MPLNSGISFGDTGQRDHTRAGTGDDAAWLTHCTEHSSLDAKLEWENIVSCHSLTTDYLVIGAGLSGLCFADELLTRDHDATITLVDRRDAPGGHWNDVYPFVKLHQPSTLYGVESRELSEYRIDQSGPNAGFLSLASGSEIIAYCHAVMRDRLLASGRVTFLPLTTYEPDGTLRGLLSGKRTHVAITRKLVDASYYTNSIPITHRRSFEVGDAISCIPPNDLPRLATKHSSYTILGSGKTGIDVCLWLLSHGVDPQRMRWISPRDQWFVNRAKVQPGPEFFEQAFDGFAEMRADIAHASSASDLALRHERSGTWLRLDPGVEPAMYHGAHMSEGELMELRRIPDVVRLGRVLSIVPTEMVLARGVVAADPTTLYIDCTASAIRPMPLVPVFQPDRIVIQQIRAPQLPFSAALIAFLEVLFVEDGEKNRFAAPIPYADTVEGYVRGLQPDFDNRLHVGRDDRVDAWTRSSRLDGFSKLASTVRPDETDRLALLRKVGASTKAAVANLPRLLASVHAGQGA